MKHPLKRLCHQSFFAFSLIEVLVATLLMALLGFLLMNSINSSARAKDSVEEISERYQLVRQAMSRMAHEIAMAYLSKNINVTEPAYVTQFKGSKNSLYFSALGYVVRQKDAKQSDQQVIGYYLGIDKEGNQSLMRSLHPNLNRDVEKGGIAQVLCPKVSKLEFSYFDGRLNKWDAKWIADSSMLAAKTQKEKKASRESKGNPEKSEDRRSLPKSWRLPSFVKITITADMGEGVSMTWITETEIPIQDPLDLN